MPTLSALLPGALPSTAIRDLQFIVDKVASGQRADLLISVSKPHRTSIYPNEGLQAIIFRPQTPANIPMRANLNVCIPTLRFQPGIKKSAVCPPSTMSTKQGGPIHQCHHQKVEVTDRMSTFLSQIYEITTDSRYPQANPRP